MTPARLLTSSPIDDFLAGTDGSSSGERWEAIGAGLGLAGTLLALGLLMFLAVVHRGRASEVHRLLLLTMVGGALMLVGGVIEIAGTADVLEIGWLDAMTDGSAPGALLRTLGGLLVLLGLGDETTSSESGFATAGGVDAPDGEMEERWQPGATSTFGLVGVALGLLSFAFDGHTVSQGPRVVHTAVNVVHVVAAGVWFGGVVALAVLARVRRGGGSIGPLLVPFSKIATIALAVLVPAGGLLAVLVLDEPGQLTGTEWGRRLLVKVAAVAVAAAVGAYHHVVVRRYAAGEASASRLAGRSVVVEATVLVVVVITSALLARASIV